MLKKVSVSLAGLLLLASPVMAVDIPEGLAPAPAYNCDYEPSCEVAPGIYGNMASPVKSKFNLSIGGFVELDYAYNSQNLGANGFALPGSPGGTISTEGQAAYQKDQSTFSARTSRFWLKVAGPTFLGAKTNALIEADFAGTSTSDTNVNVNEGGFLRLRHAYGTLDWANTQVMFGQYWDIFGPAAAATLDFRHAANMGTPNNPRVAQVRLTQKVNFNSDNYLKLIVGLQNPTEDATTIIAGQSGATITLASGTTNAGGSVPNVAGQMMFVSKALGVAPGSFGLSMNSLQAGFFGLWSTQKVNRPNAPYYVNHDVDVYGYGFYAFMPLVKSKDGKNRAMTASLETQAYIASGMDWNGATSNFPFLSATNGVTTGSAGTGGQAASLVNNYSSGAKNFGVYGQVIFYPTQDLGITTGYARRNALNNGTYVTSPAVSTGNNFEEFNDILYANAAYDLNAAVRVGAEYLYCRSQFHNTNQLTGATGALVGRFGQLNGVRVVGYYFF